jgi:hypothetical protein
VRSAESKERDEVEHLAGSGRLPKVPCCHLRRFLSGLGSVKKERAAASMFKARVPHRSSCSRHAQQRRRPSTEIRLDLNSAPQTYEPLLLASFVPRAWRANGRDPPRTPRVQRYKPHSRLTRRAFSDKGHLDAAPKPRFSSGLRFPRGTVSENGGIVAHSSTPTRDVWALPIFR